MIAERCTIVVCSLVLLAVVATNAQAFSKVIDPDARAVMKLGALVFLLVAGAAVLLGLMVARLLWVAS